MSSFSVIIVIIPVAVISAVHTASLFPLAPVLPLCIGLTLTSVPISVHASSGCKKSGGSSSGLELDKDLYNRALAHVVSFERDTQDDATRRLRRRKVEAFYEVAKSMNDSGDRISSVLMWHALANDWLE